MSSSRPVDDQLTVREFRASDGTADWPVVADGATTFFPTDSYATPARLVPAIGELEGVESGHVDIDVRLRWSHGPAVDEIG